MEKIDRRLGQKGLSRLNHFKPTTGRQALVTAAITLNLEKYGSIINSLGNL